MGSAFSQIYPVENGTPQGSVCSPILFNLMINDMFTQINMGIGRSLQMTGHCGKGGTMCGMWRCAECC